MNRESSIINRTMRQMTMKKSRPITLQVALIALLFAGGCTLPAPEKKTADARVKQNLIVLLDLSDRLILQADQPERDKEIIRELYTLFEEKVKKEMYIKSRDEIR